MNILLYFNWKTFLNSDSFFSVYLSVGVFVLVRAVAKNTPNDLFLPGSPAKTECVLEGLSSSCIRGTYLAR